MFHSVLHMMTIYRIMALKSQPLQSNGCESVHRLCLRENYEGSCNVGLMEIVHTCCKHG